MGASARFTIEHASRDAARTAAHWLPGFHPQVEVTTKGNVVELRSQAHDAATLAAIWTAALANELLLARGAAQRAAAFATLAQ